jgi:hypothetical protein
VRRGALGRQREGAVRRLVDIALGVGHRETLILRLTGIDHVVAACAVVVARMVAQVTLGGLRADGDRMAVVRVAGRAVADRALAALVLVLVFVLPLARAAFLGVEQFRAGDGGAHAPNQTAQEMAP